ncbi:MAG: ComEC/Rec2 family competence protein [Bacteroidales bacterium]|nr:ComEC/Rec2 family competence protein [Bacteroidales bacterium]
MEIANISVPLTAGVAVAAWTSTYTHSPLAVYALCGSSALILCALLALLMARTRSGGNYSPMRERFVWWALFFMLGAVCCFTAVMRANAAPVSMAAAGGSNSGALQTRLNYLSLEIRNLIAGIPFADEGNNALLGALILGDRTSLPRAEVQAFRASGAAHLLALSGMHLGIIYIIINQILKLIGNSFAARRLRSICIMAVCTAYTLMCGAGSSLVRACLFICLNETAKLVNRPQPPGQIFCLALMLHLIAKPMAISSIGFQLSYLAMVGIVFIWPKVRNWYPRPDASGFWNIWQGSLWNIWQNIAWKTWQGASLTICCQMFTGPLSYFYFGTFPKFFLISNLFAAPLMTLVMLCGLASLAIHAPACSVESGAVVQLEALLIPFLEMPFNLLRSLIATIAGMSQG